MNKYVRTVPFLQLFEQVQDLGLVGHVKCRDRFVGHDEPGLEDQGTGEADPLALATRELVRV